MGKKQTVEIICSIQSQSKSCGTKRLEIHHKSKLGYLGSFCIDEEVANLVLMFIVDLHAVWISNLVRDHGDVNAVQPQTRLRILCLRTTNKLILRALLETNASEPVSHYQTHYSLTQGLL